MLRRVSYDLSTRNSQSKATQIYSAGLNEWKHFIVAFSVVVTDDSDIQQKYSTPTKMVIMLQEVTSVLNQLAEKYNGECIIHSPLLNKDLRWETYKQLGKLIHNKVLEGIK